MGYSKRQFINAAFEEIGLARYAFDIAPEQEESALRLLDSMMAEWDSTGIRLGYPLPDSPGYSEINQATGVPDAAYEAIRTNLACKLAPQFGKQVLPATMRSAAVSMNALRTRFAQIPSMQFPRGVPVGAGNRWQTAFNQPFLRYPVPTLDAGTDSTLEFR